VEHLNVDNAMIEYEVHGTGEPVLLIHVGILADGLGRPLLAEPELASRYRLIHYHRRGYMGSVADSEPPTVARQAADAVALLRHVGVKTAHIVGHSIGGTIALQLAVDAPELVHSLVLLEPSIPIGRNGQERLDQLFGPVAEAYRSGDKRRAMEIFSDATFGTNWEQIVEHAIPGCVEQGVRDFDAFMLEARLMRQWQFAPSNAAAISLPVLSVLGVARSNQYMEQGRALLHSWFPQTEDCDFPTWHLLQIQEPKGVAHALAEFFDRHPIAIGH
jgi:pimeloyl-ACP methyl ester carboxylesterase